MRKMLDDRVEMNFASLLTDSHNLEHIQFYREIFALSRKSYLTALVGQKFRDSHWIGSYIYGEHIIIHTNKVRFFFIKLIVIVRSD